MHPKQIHHFEHSKLELLSQDVIQQAGQRNQNTCGAEPQTCFGTDSGVLRLCLVRCHIQDIIRQFIRLRPMQDSDKQERFGNRACQQKRKSSGFDLLIFLL